MQLLPENKSKYYVRRVSEETKNEVISLKMKGFSDDTVPKTVDTRRHYNV